jgi:hypothetical protein
MGKLPLAMIVLGLVGMLGRPAEAVMAYDCSSWSNIVESYSLLEPDACAVRKTHSAWANLPMGACGQN